MNRVAIVTGGRGGIGAAIVQRLLHAGTRVASFDLPGEPGHPDTDVLEIACDVSDRVAVEAAVSEVREQLGPPTILVHCAAFQLATAFEHLDPDDWSRSFHVNVDGAYFLVRSTWQDLIAGDGGRIVLITSSSLYEPPPGFTQYIATKGALVGFVRAMAVELGTHGVTVNAVAPGLTRTPNAVRNMPAEHFELVRSRQAIKRSGEPGDIAAAVAFLVSEDAGFITAQTLLVDGGESSL